MRRFIQTAFMGIGLFTAGKSVAAQGKSGNTVGVDRLVLDELPKASASACYSGSSKSSDQATTTDTLVVVPAAGATSVTLDFAVASISPNTSGKPMVLFLTYSAEKASTAQLTSKNATYPFLLGGGLQILAAYTVQPMTVQAQSSTTIGQALSDPSAKISFTIKLDMAKVNALMSSTANKLYFQAGLMPQDDLSASNFSNLILSEVDTIEFKSSCTGTSKVDANTSGKTVNSGSTSVTSTGSSKTSSTSTGTGSSKSGTSGTSTGGTSKSGTGGSTSSGTSGSTGTKS